jgi:phosphoglycerate kinase
VAVIGGAKVSTKLELIKYINTVADKIIVGGGIANTFIKASGLNIGRSLVEDSMIDIAKSIFEQGKIILPTTVVTSKSFEGDDIKEKSVTDIFRGWHY